MIIDAAELRRRRLQRLKGVRDKKVYIGPGSVCLEITNLCNLRCRHCWFHAPGSPRHLEKVHFLSRKRFCEIIDDCVDLNVDQIHIEGEGEPTLHPQFQKMMRYLEKKPLNTRLYTNATFPIEYCADVIRGDQVVINLAAVERRQYRHIHGADLFTRVVRNIRRLVALRDDQKPKFLIGISVIVNSLNVNEKQRIREFCSQMGVDSIFLKKMSVHHYNEEIALCETDMTGSSEMSPSCFNGWFYLLLKLNGYVNICCHIPMLPYCYLGKGSLKDFWFSDTMTYTRLLGRQGYLQKKFRDCQLCSRYNTKYDKTIFPDERYTNL